MDEIIGRTRLENIVNIVGERAYREMKFYMKENRTGKVTAHYDDGSSLQLEILPDD